MDDTSAVWRKSRMPAIVGTIGHSSDEYSPLMWMVAAPGTVEA